MTKAELVVAMAEKAGVDKRMSQRVLDAFIECVTATVKAGTDVRIVAFGNFDTDDRPPGKAPNPRTGATVERAASKTVKFRAGEGLKAAIQ